MLRGDVIELRPVRDADLAALYELMTNLDTRGPYFPLGVLSEPAFRAAFGTTPARFLTPPVREARTKSAAGMLSHS